MVLTHCDEGPEYFRAESYIHGFNGFSEYWPSLFEFVATGLGCLAAATYGGARCPSWLLPEDQISPEELRANDQYDTARKLTAWRKPSLPQADADISRALIVHLANTPRASDLESWYVVALCGLLAHGLDFQLSHDDETNLRIIPHMPSLIQRDESFALLHDLLVPAWETDVEGAPTFSVHPVDVQLFDPEETTEDLEAPKETRDDESIPEKTLEARKQEIREARERMTDKAALGRVRARVVSLIAASVRNDCGMRADWRYLFNMQMSTASLYLETCGDIFERIGNNIMGNVSTRDLWKWTDAAPAGTHGPWPPSMPMPVAQWLARIMVLDDDVRSARGTPSSYQFAALARMDTPPSLVVGSLEWGDLVNGVRVMRNQHWRASFETVCLAGKTGRNPFRARNN